MTLEKKQPKKLKQVIDAITEIVNVSQGKWVSARDMPLNDIYKKAGVNVNIRTYITRTLQKHGYVEHDSEIAGLKYKFKTDFIEDIEKIANEIIKEFDVKRREYQQKYYQETRGISKKEGKVEKLISSRVVEKSIPIIGDLLYVIHENSIYECKVIKIELSEDDEMVFAVRISTSSTEGNGYESLTSLKRCNLFLTPEEAANYMVLKKVAYKTIPKNN